MSTRYYKLWYRLASQDAFLIWKTNSEDGVFVDEAGRVPGFSSQEELVRYAHLAGIRLEGGELNVLNLDDALSWISSSNTDSVDCEILLEVWNLFADVSHSVLGDFDSDKSLTDVIYQKLFYGGETANTLLRPEGDP